MGHIRLGVLPKSTPWKTVINQLGDPDASTENLANSVLDNTNDILSSEASNSSVGYCVWLLAQITQASRSNEFAQTLDKLGIDVTDQTKATEFIARVSRVSSRQLKHIDAPNAINNIAGLALREALTRTVGLQGSSLFDTGLEDVQRSLKKYSTQKQFSTLLHVYFTSFISRTLRFVLDKEIANQMGPGKRFENLRDLDAFEDSLESFASQTTRIVDTFSGGWYSKKIWEQGDISNFDAEKFVHVALRKLRSDLDLNEVK